MILWVLVVGWACGGYRWPAGSAMGRMPMSVRCLVYAMGSESWLGYADSGLLGIGAEIKDRHIERLILTANHRANGAGEYMA